MTDSRTEKARLRECALARRDALDPDGRARMSAQACRRVAAFIRANESVSLFWPMRSEIDPRGLIEPVLAAGGTVVLPAVVGGRMHFRHYVGPADAAPLPLENGPFGTCHPCAGAPVVDPQLIVAPLAAFDRQGNRIGYGAGHYDRAIADLAGRHRKFRLVGMAFACQEVSAIPAEAHDRPLAAIATEAELVMPKFNVRRPDSVT